MIVLVWWHEWRKNTHAPIHKGLPEQMEEENHEGVADPVLSEKMAVTMELMGLNFPSRASQCPPTTYHCRVWSWHETAVHRCLLRVYAP